MPGPGTEASGRQFRNTGLGAQWQLLNERYDAAMHKVYRYSAAQWQVKKTAQISYNYNQSVYKDPNENKRLNRIGSFW